MVNTKTLKSRMKDIGITQRSIAESMGLSQATISQKFSGSRPLTVDEAETLCKILHIPDSDFSKYFFTA